MLNTLFLALIITLPQITLHEKVTQDPKTESPEKEPIDTTKKGKLVMELMTDLNKSMIGIVKRSMYNNEYFRSSQESGCFIIMLN